MSIQLSGSGLKEFTDFEKFRKPTAQATNLQAPIWAEIASAAELLSQLKLYELNNLATCRRAVNRQPDSRADSP